MVRGWSAPGVSDLDRNGAAPSPQPASREHRTDDPAPLSSFEAADPSARRVGGALRRRTLCSICSSAEAPMELTPIVPEGRQLIQAYREGGFTIAGARHEGSVLVLPDRTLPWDIGELATVTLESLAPILEAGQVEILILGCGAGFALAPAELRQALRTHGIVTESMDTRAACRTFNVLLAEDRRVAAALIAI
jgi:uncharacterized protein